MLRFLASVVAVWLGELREAARLVRDDRPVAILASERDERPNRVDGPLLGKHESVAVDGMVRALESS